MLGHLVDAICIHKDIIWHNIVTKIWWELYKMLYSCCQRSLKVKFITLNNVSPNFHWQKSLSTIGCNSFCNHTYLFVKPREVLRGYFDVAIAKICKTCMQSCAIDLQTCSFVNFLQWLHLNKLAKKLSVKLAKIGRKNIWSVKVGVHL